MIIECSNRLNGNLAFRLERTTKLKSNRCSFCEFKRLGAAKRTLVLVTFDNLHTLEAKVLVTRSIAGIGLSGNEVTDDTFILLRLLIIFDVELRFEGFHAKQVITLINEIYIPNKYQHNLIESICFE